MGCKWLLVLLIVKLVCLGEGCWDEERTALLQLQLEPYFYDSSYDWAKNSDCCKWDRVTCDNITSRVIQLNLYTTRDWKLEEWFLNASLFSPFQQLQWLDLRGNNIAGCIENEGHLSFSLQLYYFYMYNDI